MSISGYLSVDWQFVNNATLETLRSTRQLDNYLWKSSYQHGAEIVATIDRLPVASDNPYVNRVVPYGQLTLVRPNVSNVRSKCEDATLVHNQTVDRILRSIVRAPEQNCLPTIRLLPLSFGCPYRDVENSQTRHTVTFVRDDGGGSLLNLDACNSGRMMIPHVSHVQWDMVSGRTPPWLSPNHWSSRTRLALFVGSDAHTDDPTAALRTHVMQRCAGLYPGCKIITQMNSNIAPEWYKKAKYAITQYPSLQTDEAVRHYMSKKQETKFCLEVQGFSPGRQSMIDSILSGCVPVFVMPRDEWLSLWPLHMPWKQQGTLQLDPYLFRHQFFNLQEWLESQPYKQLFTHLVSNAHTVAYTNPRTQQSNALNVDDAGTITLRWLQRGMQFTPPDAPSDGV